MVLPLTREWIEILLMPFLSSFPSVLPLTREWIEMFLHGQRAVTLLVLPLTREWIEIRFISMLNRTRERFSLLRGSGLKSYDLVHNHTTMDGSPSYEGVD